MPSLLRLALRPLRALTLAVVVVVVAGGCGRSHLFYDARELRHLAFTPDQKTALERELAGKLAGKELVVVDEDGRKKPVSTSSSGLKSLSLRELGALWLVLSTGDVGGEANVRVRVGRGRSPVSVIVDLDGNVEVHSGKDERPDEPAPSENDIRERFHLKTSLPGKWEESERRALQDALELLNDAELDVVRDIPFDRESKGGRDESQAALYTLQGCKARIHLYPSGIKSDRFRFVGDARAPKSAVLHSLLHEIGHAVAAAPARALYCEAEDRPKQRNALVSQANDLMSAGGAAVASHEAALDGEPAVTDYGATSPQESFAESFALFHVDAAALKRARPKVFAYFARGGHLKQR